MMGESTSAAPRSRRAIKLGNVLAYALALVVVAVSVNALARSDRFRWRFDATKTRAYSLSPQTKQLLNSLDGEWRITVLLAGEGVNEAAREQVDEVLARYEAAAPHIEVQRIDPTDPATLIEYESLLTRLRSMHAEVIQTYETLLDDGEAVWEEFLLFAQQQSLQLSLALQQFVTSEQTRSELADWPVTLSLWVEEQQRIRDAIHGARSLTDAQPIPDYESARSILVATLSECANNLDAIARVLESKRTTGETAGLRQFASTNIAPYIEQAQRLVTVGDALSQLPPLEISAIGAELAGGEAALILGPRGAVVIPSAQLFPQLPTSQADTIRFDQRFRGEQVISAAIRSMLVEQMPRVVFVHAEDGSMLRQRPQRADLVGVASTLSASRIEVNEWAVQTGAGPVAEPDRTTVWIVIPPLHHEQMDPTSAELALLNATGRLLEEGQPLIINVFPSQLPKWGGTDPWLAVLRRLGVTAETGQVIYESIPVGEGDDRIENAQLVRDFRADHPVASALHGQQTAFTWPIPLSFPGPVPSGVEVTELIQVQANDNRWLEDDFRLSFSALDAPTAEQRFTEPQTIGMALSGPSPTGNGRQRVLVFGSGGWMLSSQADAVADLGGGRRALVNPGNQELMLASVAWLAGMDELIAPSPISQQIARLDGITQGVWGTWFGITALVMPLACLLLGAAVAFVRRLTG